MEDQQAPTPDDQKHGTEDGESAGADERRSDVGAEDVGSAVADARRPEALRRRWMTGADDR